MKTIVMMSMVYRFPTEKKMRLWAEACAIAGCLMDPLDFGAKEMFCVKPINSVEDVKEYYGM